MPIVLIILFSQFRFNLIQVWLRQLLRRWLVTLVVSRNDDVSRKQNPCINKGFNVHVSNMDNRVLPGS